MANHKNVALVAAPMPETYVRAADRRGTNLWRIPLGICVLVLFVFSITLAIDIAAESGRIVLPHWLSVGGYEDTQSLLSAIMGAVSTVVALVFSVTLLVFSIAESQLGPRLVYRFLNDRTMQYTIGMFLATFLFVLLTFVTLRRHGEHQFIPRITTVTCVLLVITSFGMLVAYNHRVANSIQTNDAVAEIVDDLVNVLSELRTQREDSAGVSARIATSAEEQEKTEVVARLATDSAPILARRSGYLQMISRKELLEAAVRHNIVVEILFLPGQFISENDVIARVSPAERIESFAEVLLRGIVVGANRTLQQDVEFALAQLVEVALRALSPAINDTFTGLTCIDWLGDAIRMLAMLPPSDGISSGSDGRVRLVERPLRFSQVVKSAFDQIRQAGADNPAVVIHLLRTLSRMAPQLDASQREVLLEQVESIHELATRQAFSRSDNVEIDGEYQIAWDLLTGKTAINICTA